MASLTEILPLEIIIVIIDKVASFNDDGSFTDLKACALTCNTFLPLCRKHLFHSITLDLTRRQTSLLIPFGRLVESATWVTECVRALEFSPIDNYYDISSEEQSTLEKLTMLHTLILEPQTMFGLDWNVLQPSTRSTFLRLMQLPNIVNLKLLANRHFNPFHLIPCARLKHLFLYNVGCLDVDDDSPYEPLRLDWIELDSYTAQNSDVLLKPTQRHCKPIFDLGALKSITFRITTRPEPALEIFRYTCHLENVHFKLGGACFVL